MTFSWIEWTIFGSIALAVVGFQAWFFSRTVTDYEKKRSKDQDTQFYKLKCSQRDLEHIALAHNLPVNRQDSSIVIPVLDYSYQILLSGALLVFA